MFSYDAGKPLNDGGALEDFWINSLEGGAFLALRRDLLFDGDGDVIKLESVRFLREEIGAWGVGPELLAVAWCVELVDPAPALSACDDVVRGVEGAVSE